MNEATAEVLKDIARVDEKHDQREKMKQENSDIKEPMIVLLFEFPGNTDDIHSFIVHPIDPKISA